jgi:hypothetical protein
MGVTNGNGKAEEPEFYFQFFILPTEDGLEPRAIVGSAHLVDTPLGQGECFHPEYEATYSTDFGNWFGQNGQPLEMVEAAALSERARDLGVEVFTS